MIELLQSIPAKVRQGTYFTWVLLMFVLGAVQVALHSAGIVQDPTWYVVTSEVLKYLGVPILAVAGVNVTTSSKPGPAPAWPDDEVDASGDDPRTVAAAAPGRHKAKLAAEAPPVE